MEYSENLNKYYYYQFVNFPCDSPLIGHGAVRHQHHWLEAPGLPGSGDGQVVPHKTGVDLAVVHGAGVHVLGLRHLHQLDLLAGQGVGQAAQDSHVKQGDDGQGECPADPAVTQLVVIRLEMDTIRSLGHLSRLHYFIHLRAAHAADLVVVPAGGEGEEADQEAQPGEELH